MNEEKQIRPDEYTSATKRALALMLADVASPQQEASVEFMTTSSTGKPIPEGAAYFPSKDF
ncbi:MAG: hypothetical protein DYH13_11190 [Alphaproteobacteria bacterium PRO2]|nr:hypothetical protein [Alphaproteobacteria bacterium PRO2]